ncbi:MAG TPA: alpha-2-macroglobulin family protein, partial [bacterium]|nr:alpha-2-macroglobulin family protein [bacterium]
SFPSDLYKNEDDPGTWKPGSPVFSASFDTSKNKNLDLNEVSQWSDGSYVIEIDSADRYGTAVKYKKQFRVYKPVDGPFQQNAFSKFVIITPSVEPGGSAKILAGSKAEDVNIVFEIERKNKKTETFFYRINGEKKIISVPVTESDRGNIGYSLMFQKNGRVYHQAGVIIVPWSNKQLKTEFLSFRDKLYPGQKEEWRIKITGPKAELESAEMVAALYDQSLDSFRPNYWSLWLHPGYYFYNQWLENQSHMAVSSMTYQTEWNQYVSGAYLNYDSIDWFGNYFGGYYGYGYGRGGGGRYRSMDYDGDVMFASVAETAVAADEAEEKTVSKKMKAAAPAKEESAGFGGLVTGASATRSLDKNKDALSGETAQENRNQAPDVQIRKNMAETAFFYPVLKTDEKGEVVISFTVPEALTKWKFMGLAHTKDLKTGMITKETVTQKDLMVMPNMPRFLREGDSVVISAKISSMVDKVLSGKAELKLFDAMTMKPVDKILSNNTPFQNFEIKEKGNTVVNWPVKIPLGVSAVTWRIIATAGDQGDGEEATIPVLSNRMLVTESMPLPVKGNEKKEFVFKKLIDSKSSDTLVNHRLTLEFTSNPVWYAVQALPYLMEYPYECAEQIFSRFYANSLASHIANSSPNIKKVFDQWKNTDALLSNLQKNEELKSVLLAETPWVLDAQNEEQNKKRVALLFDLNRMGNELDSALKKLKKIQGYNGGWPWFEGLPESWYITQHIVSGLGKLRNLKVKEAGPAMELAGKGILFIDNEMRKSYDWMKKNGVDMNLKHIGYMEIHYLYTRSFFTDIPVHKQNLEAYNYWISQAKKYWLGETPYMNAMEASALWRLGEKEIPQKIIDSLKERAIYNDELGMYFKENMGGYYWYQFPIETQAVIIEAFQEVTKDIKTVDDLKTWLLKMKQVQDWKTTKATVDAIYALLMGGSDWLKNNKNAEITLGNIKVDPVKMGAKTEAGTGHFKVAWNGSDIKPEMGKVTVVNPNSNPAWGAVYWQYFEQLDKITPAETPLKLEKKIFKEIQTDSGATLEPVLNNSQLKPGDRLKVRIVLRTDRDMEYIHMKDMRAAGTEPENVISRHKYQDGL